MTPTPCDSAPCEIQKSVRWAGHFFKRLRPVRRGFGRGWLGWDWWALVGSPPPFTPEKTALHTKSAQTAGL
ncbi:hypothetical protein BVL37_11780, partial [Corynebacterium diphtheriae]